jgi:hypothetical protein
MGAVAVFHRRIGETHCLQGVTTSTLTAPQILTVAEDVDSARAWSHSGLSVSRTLKVSAEGKDMLQLLDIPNWTMVVDRYWVVRGREEAVGDGGRRWRWTRLDAETAYPQVHAEYTTSGRAMEVPVNWGEWVISPAGGHSNVTYRVCTEVGGSIPEWLQKLAAQRTLPDTVADVLREAAVRAGR